MYKNFSRLAMIAIISLAFASCDTSAKKDKAPITDTIAKAPVAPAAPTAIDTGKLVGAWHDESIKTDKGESIAYEVVSSGHKVYIQAITFVGTDLKLNDTPPITASASEIRKEGEGYVSVERPNESYKVDKKGNLLIYDKGILVATCKKIL
ncbi:MULTISPECIES: hypothetical protein [unclassified Mucilaginibacter]|uniref:hypothetical protein n=1 Tax=unclassified Mucilaginibacter TaxID=2617802 RepID=UPI002AC90BEB|nr:MULTISPECIES: hypothetical protein [unclassified Mucilaginibacter]MEB0261733.1 hypothetical protein [Mucilaginibacter sp. 10I4]MEB0277597.1 hypothetical protein [Mucilaginibacter sp. 10B2]MEB0299512.1 hypothetical protein [Mucilaginibacter sp. 5C4]WPX24774.1 hypothetical protein RHM67_05755 [Mucilaginibacter sp. 5C4]